jgi:predicted O-methyltransferase YrrM
MESIKINQDELIIKNMNKFSKKIVESSILNYIFKYLMIFLFLLFIINQTKIIKEFKNINQNINENKIDKNIDLNFKYHLYEREMISEKMIKYSGWFLKKNEPYFINGIVRKFKPKKCLEIGVARGGSSIIILNALKDIDNSFLVSLDLNSYNRRFKYHIGENVKKYFPELTNNNKWQLYTGEQPHKFLDKLNLKFDFLFLDTAHYTPGELINIIEALPFLEENAIIILHDIMLHLPTFNDYYKPREVKFHPSQIFLMTSLPGYKVIIEDENKGAENIGAIFLNSNNEKDYLNYFLLLLTPWEYMPSKTKIEELRVFILKHYKKKIFLNLFNRAVEENNIYINNFKSVYKKVFKKKN